MPLPIIPYTYRTAFNWVGNMVYSPTAANVLHFASTTGDEADLVARLGANVTAGMWKPVYDGGKIDSVTVTKLDGTPDGLVFTAPNTAAWAGSGGGQGMAQCAALLKLRTASTGRSGRGRIFLPWLAEGQQNNSTMEPSVVASCTAAWTTFRAAMEADTWFLSVASYKNETAAVVTTIDLEVPTATQRRRLHRN